VSLFLLLNPKQFVTQDTSDVLDVYRKRRKKRQEEVIEEQIAAQLLQARLQDVVIPEYVSPVKLAETLAAKFGDVGPGELTGEARAERMKYLLLMLAMDD
jgi:hypothetical protein